MAENPFHIVRSRALDGTEVVHAVQRVRDKCRRHDFVGHAHGVIDTFSFKVHRLPDLDAYQQVANITLVSQAFDAEKCEAFIAMTRKTHSQSLKHAWTTWHVAESDVALEGDGKYDLNISAGLRKEGYFGGMYVYQPSPGIADINYRRRLFDRAISEMGVAGRVFTQLGDDVLYMGASAPWQLVYPSHQVSGGGNPLGFYACGFSEVETAIVAGKQLVHRFAKRIIAIKFVAKLPGEGYNAVFGGLNALWNFWDVSVMGTLKPEAIDILKGGAVSSTSPSHIPAFKWYGARGWGAYGSVIIENGQRHLEISTDGELLEQLQKRITFLDDLEFQPA